MNNLLDLLGSPPDEQSDLPGRELVRRKVGVLSSWRRTSTIRRNCQTDEVLFRGTLKVRHSASAAADLDEANLLAGIRGVEDVERSGGEHTRGERRSLDEQATSQPILHGTFQRFVDVAQ
jgi:hypothetical protein